MIICLTDFLSSVSRYLIQTVAYSIMIGSKIYKMYIDGPSRERAFPSCIMQFVVATRDPFSRMVVSSTCKF